jgi:photosystem II stability/assembly factor-like uncharacterized protein
LKSPSIHEGDVSACYYIHAAGRANGPAKLLRSESGGESFVFAGTSGDLGQSNALILKTTDGGRSWRQVYRSTRLNEILWKASFVNDRVGYATVQNNDHANVPQRIVETTDGGEHWSEILLADRAGAEELGIGFVSPDKGWVRTSVGRFETIDGGKSWTPSSLAPKANRIRTHAADGTPMISIGSEVQAYR